MQKAVLAGALVLAAVAVLACGALDTTQLPLYHFTPRPFNWMNVSVVVICACFSDLSQLNSFNDVN